MKRILLSAVLGIPAAAWAADLPVATQSSAQTVPVVSQSSTLTAPWAPWTVTSSTEVRLYSWRNDLTVSGAPAGSGSKGSEIYIPYGLQVNGKLTDELELEVAGRGGWVKAKQSTIGLFGEISTLTDTTVSGTVTYTGMVGIHPFVAIQTNLPTGSAALFGNAANARMDPDLVEISTFGEGFNLGSTLGANFLLSQSLILTTSAGYTNRGRFTQESALAQISLDRPADIAIKPGDDFTVTQTISWMPGAFSTRLTGTLSIDSATAQNGVQILRPGNRYFLQSDSSYTWSELWGATSLSLSAGHSNRNEVFDVASSALVKELTDTNSNVYRVGLQHSFPIGQFGIGPTASFLYRDHNGYNATTLQFVPQKQRWSAGVLARYSPSENLTFNMNVEAIRIRENENPALDGFKFSAFAGGLVPSLGAPAISGKAWQTSVGLNYKL